MLSAIIVVLLLALALAGVVPAAVAVPLSLICIGISLATAVVMQRRLDRIPRRNGAEAMVGEMVQALTDIGQWGQIRYDNELWSARTEGPTILQGRRVRITGIRGLCATVEPVSDSLS